MREPLGKELSGTVTSVDGDWLRPEKVARMLGISATTVYVLARRGDLPAAGWPLRIPRSELGPFLERSRVRPGDLRGSNQYAGRPTRGVGEWYRDGRAVEKS